MINQEINLNKSNGKTGDSASDGDNPSFCENNQREISPNAKKHTSKKELSKIKVLDFIRENPNLSKYDLAKLLEISYTSLGRMFREWEFVGILQSKVVIAENNRAKKLYYVKEAEE